MTALDPVAVHRNPQYRSLFNYVLSSETSLTSRSISCLCCSLSNSISKFRVAARKAEPSRIWGEEFGSRTKLSLPRKRIKIN